MFSIQLVCPSCSSDDVDAPDNNAKQELIEVPDVPEITTLSLDAKQKDALSTANDFGFELFAATATASNEIFKDSSDGNFSISPLSANVALGMASNYLSGKLKESLLSTLGYQSIDDLNETCRQLIAFLSNSDNTGSEISLANSLWWTTIYEDYLNVDVVNTIAQNYYAPNFGVDFLSSSTFERINSWVAENTDNKIPLLFDEEMASVENYIQLSINTLYADGKWKYMFDPANTNIGKFKNSSGEVFEVEMMHNVALGNYTSSDRYNAISLPFNGTMDMTIIMPKANISSIEIAKSFNKFEWENLNYSLEPALINLSMPRFHQECKAELNKALSYLGVELDGGEGNILYNSKNVSKVGIGVVQKTSLDVTEEGAQVASATVAGTTESAFHEIDFSVDSPFLYFITEKTTGAIILAGHINSL